MAEQGYLDHSERVARLHAGEPDYAFARNVVQSRKAVLTDKPPNPRWDRTVLAIGGMLEEVNALKRRVEDDISVFGGVGFASAPEADGMVDEFQLFVNPAAVGAGRSIFGQLPDGPQLQLLDSAAHDCGIVVNCYAGAAVS